MRMRAWTCTCAELSIFQWFGGCTTGWSPTLHAFNEMTRSSFTRWGGTRRFAASIPWSTQFPWQTATEWFHVIHSSSFDLCPFYHLWKFICIIFKVLLLSYCFSINPKATANLRAALLKACDKVRLAFWPFWDLRWDAATSKSVVFFSMSLSLFCTFLLA